MTEHEINIKALENRFRRLLTKKEINKIKLHITYQRNILNLDSSELREKSNGLSSEKTSGEQYISFLRALYAQSIARATIPASCGFKSLPRVSLIPADVEISNIVHNVVIELVNTELNKELLKTVPHREVLDLSIIYRWIIDQNGNETATTIINNNLLEKIELEEMMLYMHAKENTRRMYPDTIDKMQDKIMSMMDESELPEEFKEFMDIPSHEDFYIISNSRKMYGAAAMLHTETITKAAELIGGNIFILPSSRHEVLAIGADGDMEPAMLRSWVHDVNDQEVSTEDFLSNNVYLYIKDKHKLVIA